MDAEKKSSAKPSRRRSVHFVLREEDCPGLIAFLDSLENRMESKTVRAILSKWFEEQNADGSINLIEAAIKTIHDFELGALHSKAGPRVADKPRVAALPDRKPVLASESLVQPSPLPPRSEATGDRAPSGGIISELPPAQLAGHEVTPKEDATQKEPEKADSAGLGLGLGFVNSMLGITNG